MVLRVDSARPGPDVDESPHSIPLSTGTPAPDFQLPVTPHRTVALSDFRGQPVILAFYPADWGPVSRDQIALYQAKLPMVRQFGAELIGISVDGICSHQEFARQLGLEFPLLADFEPKGCVARTASTGPRWAGARGRSLSWTALASSCGATSRPMKSILALTESSQRSNVRPSAGEHHHHEPTRPDEAGGVPLPGPQTN